MNQFDSTGPDAVTAAVAQCIADHTGMPFEPTGSQACSGGSINQAQRFTGSDGRAFFVKLSGGEGAALEYRKAS